MKSKRTLKSKIIWFLVLLAVAFTVFSMISNTILGFGYFIGFLVVSFIGYKVYKFFGKKNFKRKVSY